MNMKRATTVEQSKQWLNIEIDPKSADHILLNFGDGEYQLDVLLEGEEVSDKDLKFYLVTLVCLNPLVNNHKHKARNLCT